MAKTMTIDYAVLAAEIRAQEAAEKAQKAGKKASKVEDLWTMPKRQENAAQQGIELVFAGKPAKALRNVLTALSLRWNNRDKVWYIKQANGGAAVVDEAMNRLAKVIENRSTFEKLERGEALTAAELAIVSEVGFPLTVKAHPAPAAAPPPAAAPAAAPAPAPATSSAIAAGMHFVDYRLFTVKSFPDNDHVRVADETGKERTCKLLKAEGGAQYIVVNNRRAVLYRK